MEKDLIRLVAEMISGMHVPRSLKGLGVAEKPYDEIRERINDHGWSPPEVIEKLLREKYEVKERR